jgi:YbbR domain-containing protein
MAWIKRNFGLRVIALITAVVLWFTFNYQSSSQAFTKTLEVPLALHGVSGGLVASTATQEVAIELQGTRPQLADISPENFVAYVDCSGKRAGTYALGVSVVGPQTDKPLSVTPSTAVVVLENYEFRRVPVVADVAGPTVVTAVQPRTIVVTGGESDVARVFAAQASVAAASAAKPATIVVKVLPVDVHLAVVSGVSMDPPTVRVTIAPAPGRSKRAAL